MPRSVVFDARKPRVYFAATSEPPPTVTTTPTRPESASNRAPSSRNEAGGELPRDDSTQVRDDLLDCRVRDSENFGVRE